MTALYSSNLLSQEIGEKDRYGRQIGFFKLPDMESMIGTLCKKYPSYGDYYFSKKAISPINDYRYDFHISPRSDQCTIQLTGYSTPSGATVMFAQITIQTVNANCGSIIISNLQSDFPGCGFGKALLRETLRYLDRAGYSFLLLNTAGKNQNPIGTSLFQKQFGFHPLKNQVYVNKRSANANIWYFKILPDVTRLQYSEAANYLSKDDLEDDNDGYDEDDWGNDN
jgi:hypothetical protein